MQKIIHDYNHNLAQKLVDKAKIENWYEDEYADEVRNFDLAKYLEAK